MATELVRYKEYIKKYKENKKEKPRNFRDLINGRTLTSSNKKLANNLEYNWRFAENFQINIALLKSFFFKLSRLDFKKNETGESA